MTMGAMEDSNSKSLEKVLAQQRQKEIAADDYSHKIENWLRLADQMLGLEATHGKPGPAAGNRPSTASRDLRQATAEKGDGKSKAKAATGRK